MIQLDFTKSPDGLIPAIVQDWQSKQILMLAYINQEAWEKTLATGIATYWTRSRNKIWIKGEQSGNTQHIKEIRVDCDQDTVIYQVEQKGGAACHLGYRTCFFRKIEKNKLIITDKPIFDPQTIYNKKG